MNLQTLWVCEISLVAFNSLYCHHCKIIICILCALNMCSRLLCFCVLCIKQMIWVTGLARYISPLYIIDIYRISHILVRKYQIFSIFSKISRYFPTLKTFLLTSTTNRYGPTVTAQRMTGNLWPTDNMLALNVICCTVVQSIMMMMTIIMLFIQRKFALAAIAVEQIIIDFMYYWFV